MDVLDRLFGSHAQVKIMRLFLFHPGEIYEPKDVVRLARVDSKVVRRELENLSKAGLVQKKSASKETKVLNKNGKPKKKKVSGWMLNADFPYLKPLQNILVNVRPLSSGELAKRFHGAGTIKFLVVSGVFLQQWESRVDLLVVGDKLSEARVHNVVKVLESEVGRELSYASFSTQDFLYRLDVYDKLIRDILDYPHERIVDKLQIQ